VLIAVIQVTIRAMTATESALSIALSFTVIVFGVMSLSALGGGWVRPSAWRSGRFWARGSSGRSTWCALPRRWRGPRRRRLRRWTTRG
jgi:hypothetical protein